MPERNRPSGEITASACGHTATGNVRFRSDTALQAGFQFREPIQTTEPANSGGVITLNGVAAGPRRREVTSNVLPVPLSHRL
jgi:hypothetical protein